MERMTFEGDFCVIARCSDIPGDSLCEDGTCFQLRVWERLKAIEDVLGNEYDLNRLRELAKADREGRVVVLPTFCDGCAHHSEHDGKHWCKFWHRYCPDDSDFYCKAAKKLLEGDAGDEQA